MWRIKQWKSCFSLCLQLTAGKLNMCSTREWSNFKVKRAQSQLSLSLNFRNCTKTSRYKLFIRDAFTFHSLQLASVVAGSTLVAKFDFQKVWISISFQFSSDVISGFFPKYILVYYIMKHVQPLYKGDNWQQCSFYFTLPRVSYSMTFLFIPLRDLNNLVYHKKTN